MAACHKTQHTSRKGEGRQLLGACWRTLPLGKPKTEGRFRTAPMLFRTLKKAAQISKVYYRTKFQKPNVAHPLQFRMAAMLILLVVFNKKSRMWEWPLLEWCSFQVSTKRRQMVEHFWGRSHGHTVNALFFMKYEKRAKSTTKPFHITSWSRRKLVIRSLAEGSTETCEYGPHPEHQVPRHASTEPSLSHRERERERRVECSIKYKLGQDTA